MEKENMMDPTNEHLSDEQRKRLDLLEAYENESGPERQARNDALEKHDAAFTEKWMSLQSEIELKRAQSIERLRSEGHAEQQVQSMVSAEIAALTEGFMAEKDLAARSLDLATPQSWRDWLIEKKRMNPEDPTFDSLIEEAKTAPSLDGFLKSPPPRSVVSELVPQPASDGRVDYMRGMLVAVTDTGARLDVKRSDERDIEAALKIAAQKFDMDKGLMLTGDMSFKRRAAEIAGRLGYKLQNAEPEVLMAYRKGLAQAARPEFARIPSVANGVEGDALDRAVATLKGPMILKADPHTLKTLENKLIPGVETASGETIVMPGERVWQAHAEMREMPIDVLPIVAEIDISKEDGGLTPEQLAKLEKENQGLVEDGKLTPKAVDLVLVRDNRVIVTREGMEPDERKVYGTAYLTAGDVLRQREQQLEQDQAKAQEQQVAKPDMPELPAAASRKKDIDIDLGR